MTTATSHTPTATPLALPGWGSMLSAPILARALAVALILGSILTAINQPGFFSGASAFEVLPLALVYITPFAVVTLSQILGIRQALRDGKPLSGGERFLATIFAHGIPARAAWTGFLVGTINGAITVSAALIATGNLTDIPAPLLVQAYTLPVLFGLLSQAISYRRAAAQFGGITV